jgi:hypothetical protein
VSKLKTSLIVILLLTATGAAQAEEGKLSVTFDTTYMSKWMTKGAEGYGPKGAFFETIDVDLWGTGAGIAVGHQSAIGGDFSDKQRFNYKLYYGGSLFEDQAYQIKYKLNWTYKNYYSRARDKGNSQEWVFAFSWPKILDIEGLAPYYIVHYEHPAGSSYNNYNISGLVHRFGLKYNLDITELPNPLCLSGEAAYRDGLGGPAKDHEWTHATLGVATKFNIAEKLSFVPGLYYQISMDDSLIRRDVIYTKLSMKYKF